MIAYTETKTAGCNPRRWLVPILLLGIAVLHVQEANGQKGSPAQRSTYNVITVDSGGTITGVVRFESEYPPRERIRVSTDLEVCGTRKSAETFIVSPENKGLKNVVVTVEGIAAGKAPTVDSMITLEQKSCAYVPHIQVAQIGPTGVPLRVVNQDGILHNVHSYFDDRTAFNVAQPGFKKELRKTLKKPGVMTFKCDVHSWMNAYIVILENQPYYAVTDEQGHFSIADVPPGTYTLQAWHEALGTMEKPVTVGSSGESAVDFVIKPRGKSTKGK